MRLTSFERNRLARPGELRLFAQTLKPDTSLLHRQDLRPDSDAGASEWGI
jgi:hypothetical protein